MGVMHIPLKMYDRRRQLPRCESSQNMIQSTHKSFGRIRVRTLKLRGGMEFTGTVTGIKFRNEENGWTVLRIKGDDGEELTAVGVMPSVNDGERVTVTGNMTAHPMYGEQIRVTS